MKTLTIGATSFAITNCTRHRDTVRGFYLNIEIPKENIGMDELYNLLDGTEEPIVVTEADGTVNTYRGFKTLGGFACENGVYKIAQVCTSEYEAQLSLAQNKIEEQNKALEATNQVIGQQNEVINAQAEAIAAQGLTIDSQSETIAAQAEELVFLGETATVQMSTIDSLLLDIIPAVIADAVTVAVADALVSNSNAGDSETETVPEEPVAE